MLASRTERQVAGSLAPLSVVGYTFRHDRGLPRPRTANNDHVRPDWIDIADRDDEAQVIHRRELYVGMTRARDELWVGVCA